jgi:hypothetical protein
VVSGALGTLEPALVLLALRIVLRVSPALAKLEDRLRRPVTLPGP